VRAKDSRRVLGPVSGDCRALGSGQSRAPEPLQAYPERFRALM
jgi:hypothetical protein